MGRNYSLSFCLINDLIYRGEIIVYVSTFNGTFKENGTSFYVWRTQKKSTKYYKLILLFRQMMVKGTVDVFLRV